MWEGVGDWTELQPSVSLSRSPGLLNQRPSSLLAFSTASCLQNSPISILNRGSRGPLLLGAVFLYCILSPMGLVSKLTDFPSSPSYIIVQSPTQSLEWHVWPSSRGNNRHAFHRSLSSGASVYDYCGILTLSHIVSQACPHQWNMHFRHFWNGMFGGVGGEYTTLYPLVFMQFKV